MRPSPIRDLFDPQKIRPFVRRATKREPFRRGARVQAWGVYTRSPNGVEHCAGMFLDRCDARQFAQQLRDL